MDISDINKVANRKKINGNVEKLREKVSQETAKIIKLKVAQDTAYWDLKEKLKGVEREHERLQRNMVEVQMQHEAVSARHQDELRLRPETLNKLASTREICNVLEEHVGRVRSTLQRCAADRESLAAAYARAAAAVEGARADLASRAAAAASCHRTLHDAHVRTVDHLAQLTQCAAAATRHADDTKAMAQARTAALTADADRLRDIKDSLADQLARTETRLEEKEKTIQELKNELKRVTEEFAAQNVQARNSVAELEREAGAAAALRGSLAAAETRGEAATREVAALRGELAAMGARCETAVREAKCALAELAAAVEAREAATREVSAAVEARDAAKCEAAAAVEACNAATREVAVAMKAREMATQEATAAVKAHEATLRRCDALERQYQEAQSKIDKLTQEIQCLDEKNDGLLKTIEEKEKSIRALEGVKNEARRENEAQAEEVARLAEELKRVSRERDEAREAGERAAAAEQCAREERMAAAAAADRELADRAATIARLMQDVSDEVEARARADAALRATRADLDAAREDATRADEHVRRLDAALRAAQKDGADQMKIILEIRGEKERLQERIRDMQSKIDNIQKLTREQPAPSSLHREPPEHDDNAVTTPPKPLGDRGAMSPPPAKRSFPKEVFATPDPPVDTHIFNFLSDSMSSMEDNAIDPVEVNRRFEALSRGLPLPRVPLSALKRRRNVDRVNRPYPAATKQGGASQSAAAAQSASAAQESAAQESRVKFFKTRRPNPCPVKQK